jgi:hypothetical protein
MREAMVEARALFEDLVTPGRRDTRADRADRHDTAGRQEPARRDGAVREDGRGAAASDGHHRSHLPWALTRRHAKGS